ncbi:MAG: response regulator transcription factor [Caldimonas sp.]
MIDQHSFFLASFGAALLRCSANLNLVSVETAAAAFEVLSPGHSFDLVLLDLQQADGKGFELLAGLQSKYPSLPVIVSSNVDSNAEIVRAVYFGATGFVPRRASGTMFIEAIRAVRSGRIFMPPMFASLCPDPASLFDEPRRDDGPLRQERASADFAQAGVSPVVLTRRQADVLELLMEGQSNKAMARVLNLSVDTVKDHVAAVLRTLNVRSRTQAVLAVSRLPAPGWRSQTRGFVRRGEESIEFAGR